MRIISNWLANITIALGASLGAIMFLMCVACLFTPHKTKFNEYTDVVKYWTDDAYFCSNFNCPEKGVKQ